MHRPYSAHRTFLLYWLPVALWAGLIFAFSAQSNLKFAEAAPVDFVVRKAGHMFVFGVLAVLLWRALTSARIDRAVVWSWLIATAYAGTDELHQSFTSGRHPSPVDVGIDAAGALIALYVLVVWVRLRARGRAAASGYSATGNPRILKPPST
ncbi:MAG: VanZ family protein [Candidatus Limnocylindrales bacterium]